MHAIKGGWTGRPLALAKHNESEGRKTRIRLSKEERKSMVEVFIKKYQESNNGSFPSLNLTHKEVGGSFYTVREIVRDIIQENRVLGPGKLLLEELSTYHSLEENPLHSIAIEPQSPLTLSSREVGFPVNYNQCINEEPIFVSDEYTSTNIQGSQNGPIINGSLVDVSDKDSDDFIKSELLVNKHKKVEEVVKEESGMPINHAAPLAADVVVNEHKKVEEVVKEESGMPINHVTPLAADVVVNEHKKVEEVVKEESGMPINHVTPLAADVVVNEHKKVEEVVKEESGMPINHVTPLAADVVVETFPLDSVSWAVNSSDVRSETLISTSASEKQVSQTIELESDVSLFNVEGNNSTKAYDCVVEIKKAEENFESPLSETKSDLVEVAQIVEISNVSTVKKGSIYEVEGPGLEVCTDTPISGTFEQGHKSSEMKARNASPSGTGNLNKTFNNGIDQATKIKEETEIENKATGGSQKESIPTLNRINLESWEGMSKNSPKPENNPLFEILKAFIASFVKFWSE